MNLVEYEPKRLFVYGTLKDIEIARKSNYFPKYILEKLKGAKSHPALANGFLLVVAYPVGITVPTFIPGEGTVKGKLYDFSYLNYSTWERFLKKLDVVEGGYKRVLIPVRFTKAPLNTSEVKAWIYQSPAYQAIDNWNPKAWYKYKYLFPRET